MFTFPVSTTSATSDTAYALSNEIILNHKHFDNKYVSLKIDISGSAVSGLLDVIYGISDVSGGTLAYPVTSSGSSKVLSSGTSIGGAGRNGSYYLPLTIAVNSGVTHWLKGSAPYIKIGTKASYRDMPINMKLIVG